MTANLVCCHNQKPTSRYQYLRFLTSGPGGTVSRGGVCTLPLLARRSCVRVYTLPIYPAHPDHPRKNPPHAPVTLEKVGRVIYIFAVILLSHCHFAVPPPTCCRRTVAYPFTASCGHRSSSDHNMLCQSPMVRIYPCRRARSANSLVGMS